MFYIVNAKMDEEYSDLDQVNLLVYADSFEDAFSKVRKNCKNIYKISVEQVGDGIMGELPFIHLPEDKAYINKPHEANSMQY